MIILENYNHLERMKNRILEDNIKNEKDIYTFINMYRENLNLLYTNKKIPTGLTKEDLENKLNDFARQLLRNTNRNFRELENKYKIENRFNTNIYLIDVSL